MPARYALYYTPARTTLLYSRVSRLFGRTILSALPFAPEIPEGFSSDEWQAIVKEPAHYGLHATLKAPFVFREQDLPKEQQEEILCSLCAQVARRHAPFDTAPLTLARLQSRNGTGSFLALTPAAEKPSDLSRQKMLALEKDCVLSLESVRAPLSEADVAARGALDEKEAHYLRTFGYHLVFDRFRFHLTLTGCLSEDRLQAVEAALKPLLAPMTGKPLRIDSLSLCYQEERNQPFVEVKRFDLHRAKVLQAPPLAGIAS